jgi:hypothetical protein
MLNKTDFVMRMGYFALVGTLPREQGRRPLGRSCESPCLCKVIWFVASWAICYMNKQLPLKDRIDKTRALLDQTLSWTVGGVLQLFLINLYELSYLHNDCFWVKVG